MTEVYRYTCLSSMSPDVTMNYVSLLISLETIIEEVMVYMGIVHSCNGISPSKVK